MQPQLRAVVEAIEPAEAREFIGNVFNDLNRLLGYLDSVKATLRAGGRADDVHLILEAVRCEALAAAGGMDFFCARQESPTDLSGELERTGFAVRHELRIVFEQILPDAREGGGGEDARSRLAHAHEVLRNCFEQSTISLARTFRPDLDAAEIFEDIQARRDNSLRLYEDLDALLRSARHAEWHGGGDALLLFSERLELFRAESMRHLMQKDRETCQGFIDGLSSLHDRRAMRLYIHRFACYLEILLKHVSMRSVLAETPLSAAA